MTIGRRPVKLFMWLCLPWLAFGCLGTRYLEGNQKLLYRQTIVTPPKFPREGLGELPVQTPNRRFLGLPIHTLVWMHHEGLVRFRDSTSRSSRRAFEEKKVKVAARFDRKIASGNDARKISSFQFRKQKKLDALDQKISNGNRFMQWGEAASLYDSVSVARSAENIHTHLFNNGYFLNRVTPKISERKNRRVEVVYQVAPGQPYVIDTLWVNAEDAAIEKILLRSAAGAKIRAGDLYNQTRLTAERERIESILKDNGYYDFSRQYIDFDVDTSYREGRNVAVRINIHNPPKKEAHRRFRIDSVAMTVDAGVRAPASRKRLVTPYRDLTFSYFKDLYSERILSQRVFLHPDSLYSRSSMLLTQRQLANLDAFKFVNINYDTSQGRFIANIFASPQERYSISNEAGVTVTQGFPGPYYSLSLKKRNVLRGLENFELNGRFGFEGVAAVTALAQVYRSTEATLNGIITFPQIILPLRESFARQIARYNPRTRMLAGYTFTSRPEYTREIITISNTFNWEGSRNRSFSFTPTNLNIINSQFVGETGQAFLALLDTLQRQQGNNLINSFRPSYVASMMFNAVWNPDNYGNTEKTSRLLRVQAESGGTIFNLIEPGFALRQGLEVFQYLRLNADFRKHIVLDRHTAIAYRINTGLVYAYGDNRTVPYEKFFFAGGSNSLRAWRPRRLGIGTLPNRLSADPQGNGLFDYRFEKPGEILVEASAEYRKKLFGFVNFALFVDVGNVWNFREVTLSTKGDLPGWAADRTARFQLDENFWNQWGVGTGFGLRFDFTFLILRLDAGIKAYDPGRDAGDRFVLNRARFFGPFGVDREPVIYNIGIGYPF
jgi:outer membrane protein assembly factor BamA